jgi:hypothetical protein
MRILIDATAAPGASTDRCWTRLVCTLSCEAGGTTWMCEIDEQPRGQQVVCEPFVAELADLLPAVRNLLTRLFEGPDLLLVPDADAVLKQRLALRYADEHGWRAERCLCCMGFGTCSIGSMGSGEGSCVLCGGDGLRYWHPRARAFGYASFTYRTDDLFRRAIGGDNDVGAAEPLSIAS